jgi:histone deacetylase HOS3
MSRHGRKVPVSFYYRFAQDAVKFANEHTGGRLVSVLEGGYSDRALTSGAMAHLTGLVDTNEIHARKNNQTNVEEWWDVDNLIKVWLICDFMIGFQHLMVHD